MLFIGQYSLKLDRKGKISLPDTFTKVLEKQSFQGLYFFPSSCGRYLEAASEAWMMHFSKHLESEGAFDGLDHPQVYAIFDQVVPAPLEKNGRITVPESFLKFFPMRSSVMLVGYGYRFGIWLDSDYQSYLKSKKSTTTPTPFEQKATAQTNETQHAALSNNQDISSDTEPNINHTDTNKDTSAVPSDPDVRAPSTIVSQKKEKKEC